MTNQHSEPHENDIQRCPELYSATYRSNDPADLIVYVRHTLGFLPRESAVLICVEPTHLSSVLRANLPNMDATAAEQEQYLQDAFDQYELVDPDHYIIMIIFHDGGEDDRSTAYDDLMWRAHAMTKKDSGVKMNGRPPMPIKTLLQATNDTLYSLLPFSVEEWDISTEALALQPLSIRLAVDGYSAVNDVATAVQRLQAPHWSKQHALRVAIKKYEQKAQEIFNEQDDDEYFFGEYIYGRLRAWDRWITRIAATSNGSKTDKDASSLRADRVEAARLVADLAQVRMRDLIMLAAHFNFQTALVGSLHHYFDVDFHEELLDEFLSHADEEEQVEEEAWYLPFLSRSLMGTTESVPNWSRNRALNAMLRELLPLAGEDARQAILGILAWLEWIRGCSTFAIEYLEIALTEDPAYRFNILFKSLLDTGRISGWAGKRPTV